MHVFNIYQNVGEKMDYAGFDFMIRLEWNILCREQNLNWIW